MSKMDVLKAISDEFPYGIEYANGIEYRVEQDFDSDTYYMTVDFGCGNKYEIEVCIKDREPRICIYDDATVPLDQENVYAYCLFEEQKRRRRDVEEIGRLRDEINMWKDATGLEKGGDPDALTPDDLRSEIASLHLDVHDAEMAMTRMSLAVGKFCRECEYRSSPGACPDCPLEPYGV